MDMVGGNQHSGSFSLMALIIGVDYSVQKGRISGVMIHILSSVFLNLVRI